MNESPFPDISPEQVVADARDPLSPLHAAIFDRSVEDAAEEYYLERARKVLNDLVAVDNGTPEVGHMTDGLRRIDPAVAPHLSTPEYE